MSPVCSRRLRALAPLLVVLALLVSGWGTPVDAAPTHSTHAGEPSTDAAARKTDPRRTRGLFVDPLMPAYKRGGVYRDRLGRYSQALWIIPEAYPADRVRDVVRAYTSRAIAARKTPVMAVYGIPDRDCSGHSSAGALTTAAQYRVWIKQVAKGLQDQKALVVLEPDALPFYGDPSCTHPGDRLGMLAYASKTLSASGAWVYLDAGQSVWHDPASMAPLLKRAGLRYDRGFSVNVSNFLPTSTEQTWATQVNAALRKLKVTGKRYVIDTSRNGATPPTGSGYDTINPTWARVGKPPRLVFKGAFDGTLWVKHPGESDGYVNGGNASGQWCDLLADRLLNRTSTLSYCP